MRNRNSRVVKPDESGLSSNLLLALGAAGLAYYLASDRSSSDGPSSSSGTALPTPRNSRGQRAPSPALLDRLDTSPEARMLFAIQSLAYSVYLTESSPDGIMGPDTLATLREISSELGIPVPQTITPDYVRRFSAAARFDRNPRLQPMWLPRDLVVMINRESIGYNPNNETANVLMPLQTFYEQ